MLSTILIIYFTGFIISLMVIVWIFRELKRKDPSQYKVDLEENLVIFSIANVLWPFFFIPFLIKVYKYKIMPLRVSTSH